jgi:hypothetical protein
MKIIELYRHLLATGSLSADEEGMISASMQGITVPFTVDGKRMVLPTRENMASEDKTAIVLFHPLSENVWRNESSVLEKFRMAINTNLNWVLGGLCSELLHLVTSQPMHAKIPPDLAGILSCITGADEQTFTTFNAIKTAMGIGNKDKCFAHMFLKKNGKIGSRTYTRAAIVSFPLYAELKGEGKQVFGVKVRPKDKLALQQLLKFVVPGIDKANSFDRGSESDVAPFLDALMKGLLGLAGNVNTLVSEYEQFIDQPELYIYNDQWIEVFDNLAQMLPQIRMIPMQSGNEGAPDDKPTTQAQALQTPAPNTPPQQPAYQQPQQPQQSAYQQPQQPQQSAYQQPQQPAYQHPQQQQPVLGGVKDASGKVDFEASMRANPQLAASMHSAYGQQPQQLPPGPMSARLAPPIWDRPNAAPGYYPPQWPNQQHPQGQQGSPQWPAPQVYVPGRSGI